MRPGAIYDAALAADELLANVGLPKFTKLAEFAQCAALGDMDVRSKAQVFANNLGAVNYDVDEIMYLTAAPRQPIAWIRTHPDGTLTSEILADDDARLSDGRKESGAWLPLFAN